MFLSLFTSRWCVLFIVIGLPDRNLEPFPSACGLTLMPLANYNLPPGHWALPTACTHPPPGAVNIENYSCETDPRSLIISVVCPRHRHRAVASWSHTGREANGHQRKYGENKPFHNHTKTWSLTKDLVWNIWILFALVSQWLSGTKLPPSHQKKEKEGVIQR